MANNTHVCLCRIPGQLSLEDKYRNQCYSIFLKSLQAPKPESCDELLYSAVGTVANGQVFRKRACLLDGDGDVCVCVVQVTQGALKGLHCCLSGGKWRFGGGEEVGALLATLKVSLPMPCGCYGRCCVFSDWMCCVFSDWPCCVSYDR